MSFRSRYPSLPLVGALFVGLLLGRCAPPATVPVQLPTTLATQPTAPTPDPIHQFPGTRHTLQGAFRRFWEQHDGARALGPPVSAPIQLDGRTVQFFGRARLELAASGVVSATLAQGWEAALPADLLALEAAPQQATIVAPPAAQPLLPVTVTLSIPGYSGPLELRVYDGRAQVAGVWTAQVANGAATIMVEG